MRFVDVEIFKLLIGTFETMKCICNKYVDIIIKELVTFYVNGQQQQIHTHILHANAEIYLKWQRHFSSVKCNFASPGQFFPPWYPQQLKLPGEMLIFRYQSAGQTMSVLFKGYQGLAGPWSPLLADLLWLPGGAEARRAPWRHSALSPSQPSLASAETFLLAGDPEFLMGWFKAATL